MNTRLSIFYFVLLLFFASSALFSPVTGDLAGDRQALLDFLNNITHPRSLTWNASTPVCATWPGVTCDKDGTRVTALHLPGASLLGVIPPGTISRLSELQILSLRSNGLRGPFPVDFLQLTKLKAISLSNNRFSGPLPSDYATWTNLTVLDLYGNRFNGSVPAGFANLTGLDSLNLAQNSFSGEIPDLNLPGLRRLNFSNNNLTGSIPKSLRRFGNSAFSGNNLVYENASPPPVIPPIEKEKEKKGIYISKPAILAIAISLCFVIFFLIAVVIIVCYVKRQRRQETETTPEKLKPAQKMPSEKEVSKLGKEKNIEDMEDKSEINRVMFFEGSNLAFNLEDLLIASAEFLGKGTFGMTYKAVLEDSKVIAVKRLKDVVVSRKYFKHQMEIVGNIRHENVAPLRAYVCSKEEKLMVYDYYSAGSLSHLLHGKNGEDGHVPLNWETRLRFMIGVAKGLAHIHTHKLAHGNIKSSNIFMNSEEYGCISEAGLAVLTNPVTKANASARRYRAPEATDTRRSTAESDVYGFGILMLETLTGRSSMDDAKEGIDLVVWVNEVIAKQWTGEVFDLELVKTPNVEAKLLQMLQLGTSCTARVPAKRPEMVKVVETLEEIERKL
ncbi:PREDICTED: inactive leucine-rich repeat receptor-like serine/threonine-protein kinase At5g24100 [Camelina sativa]|uniref:Inactive leucine-rich repeat receptor-like serine/threonine-protein kinase At5g24100 n=1 Tax=Camelina sativa TaxID=90675 RepID=A0ABM0Y0A6_CAMSA|nr:PREDICTED: inactive leucine-rich repeat receptor-like serine/threonine-protein kinase At5g24100 [Camelina sativa]XP_010493545.1 PREDICTED: inactive leucine-rich repeat receptor-like serine/threonine-protein kinase At5g24100 [Camelina sativa]